MQLTFDIILQKQSTMQKTDHNDFKITQWLMIKIND